MARLDNPQEMELIYQTSKQVYAGLMSASSAAKLLVLKTPSSEASLKMYFTIYSCMRRGVCYKKGTSASFTKFLIERILADEGKDAIYIALAAAKQNADYRKQCNNEQPGIEAICREIITAHKLKVKYEDLDRYAGKGPLTAKEQPLINKQNVILQDAPNGTLRMKIVIGAIEFEAEGDPKTVIAQQKTFAKDILPSALASLSQVYDNSGGEKTATKSTSAKKATSKKNKSNGPGKASPKKKAELEDSLGKKIIHKFPVAVQLTDRMDFKAKMIPLMYLAAEGKYQYSFTVPEIKKLLNDAIGIQADAKQIKDVITRRTDWFKVSEGKPVRYQLVDIGCDYAKNILAEYK